MKHLEETQIEKRRNPRLKYLFGILDFYYSKEAGEYINSKIAGLSEEENGVFCVKCSRSYIPKVTCEAKEEAGMLRIECICGHKVRVKRDKSKEI